MENIVYTGKNKKNILSLERALSLLVGSYLIYDGLKNKRSLTAIPGGILALRAISGYCPFYDIMGKREVKRHNVNIQTRMIINKPVDEVYRFWRQLENLPLFMHHLKSVEQTGLITSQWIAKIPGGLGTVSWNAVIVNEKENEVLGWASYEDSMIDNAGKVEFVAIGPYTTELHVVISYRAPMGTIGEDIARLFAPSLKKSIKRDIDRFAEYVENGFLKDRQSDFRNEMI